MGCGPREVLFAAARSLEAVQAVGGLAAGSVREPAAKHLRARGQARAVLACLRSGLDRLLGSRLAFDGGERRIAQFAQKVVGAPAQFASERQTGAVVVDATRDLQVVAVVGRGLARGLV